MDWVYFSFDRPAYLALLLLLPLVWLVGRRSLGSLGRMRHALATAIRIGLFVLLTCALAEIQLVRITERIAAYFLIDQSTSVDPQDRDAALSYANAAVQAHRRTAKGDQAGVIVFGGEARIEAEPASFGELPNRRETIIDPSHTNIADALRLAKASFPPDTARRVVLLSDGNQNIGDALSEARKLADDGIGIDVAPLPHRLLPDVVVDKIAAPAAARAGVPYDVSIVLDNRAALEVAPRPVAGQLIVLRKSQGETRIIADQPVTLPPGKSVFAFRQQLDEAAFHTYEARFVPADALSDKYAQNNHATTFTQISGRGRVLLIVNAENPGEFDDLIATLRRHEIVVDTMTTTTLFNSLSELQNYDCVVLGNVPRINPESPEAAATFSDAQIDMLVRNVEQFGAGLVMLGGRSSFGAGGWNLSALEKAMPVDFQVDNDKVVALGALMLVIDKSGSMTGQKLELSKAAARAAVQMLNSRDYVGVIAFDSEAEEVVPLQRIGDGAPRIAALISRLGPGGGTDMEPGMRRGYEALRRNSASVKHMIVLTDGQTAGSGYSQLVSSMRKQNITTTAVAVGPDAAKQLLQTIARLGGGKFYQANNPNAIPRIFMRETRRVVRPLIHEDGAGIGLIRQDQQEILGGIDGDIPPITGYVLTRLKQNPLVETPLVAAGQTSPNNAILSTWTYGLGRTVAFTTDTGQRWAKDWSNWPQREQLLVQMIRWAMRPIAEEAAFAVNSEVRDGRLHVTVQAITEDGRFLNDLPLQGALVRDDAESTADMEFNQVGPGRYQAEIPLDETGSHLLAISPGPGYGLLRSGVNIPYSPEFRELSANEELLISLANLQPRDGKPGEIIRLPDNPQEWRRFAGANIFRRDLRPGQTLTGVWPLVLVIAGCVFLLDVGNRRVSIAWGEVGEAFNRWRARRQPAPDKSTERLDRLKGAKQAAAARFTPPNAMTAEPCLSQLPEAPHRETPAEPAPHEQPNLSPGAPEEESYAARLLRAKQTARHQAERRGRGPDNAP